MIAEDENSESLTKGSGNKSEITTQIGALNESLEKLNEKLIKVMSLVQVNSDNFKQLSNDLTNLKNDVERKFDDIKRTNYDTQTLMKNMVERKEKVPDEDMSSLVLELKNCIKSYRSIENDNSAIKEKIYQVYGRNFFAR